MNMTNALLLFAACTSLAPTAMAATGHAHEHGVASLNVARSGGSLLIELDGPLDNFVGFEHAPRNAEQKRRLTDALAILREPARVVNLPAAAACRLVDAAVAEPFAEKPGAAHEAGDENHADLEANWHFECANAAALDGFEVTLFKHFPRLGKLRVQVAGDGGQSAQTLRPASAQVGF